MDPFSHAALGAALGATLAQSAAKPSQQKTARVIGVLAGMAPDLDIQIQSKADPLLFLE